MKPDQPNTTRPKRLRSWLACGFGLLCCVASTGCQITEGGQVLPSPHYLDDDVQFFSHGPEFPLSEEANRLKAARADNQLQNRGR